jgi:hypothetical protein
MKKIIVLLTLLLFINTKGFGREVIIHHRFIPIDLERTYLVSECGECGNPVTVDSLLYSPKTQYYYYPNGEMCRLESIKCNNCEEKPKQRKEKGANIIKYILYVVAFLTLFGMFLG